MLNFLRREGLTEAYEHRPIGRMIRAGLKSEIKTARHALRPRPLHMSTIDPLLRWIA